MTKVVEETKKVVKHAEKSASEAGKVVSKKVEQAVEATKEQAQKVTSSVEEFAANLGGLSIKKYDSRKNIPWNAAVSRYQKRLSGCLFAVSNGRFLRIIL